MAFACLFKKGLNLFCPPVPLSPFPLSPFPLRGTGGRGTGGRGTGGRGKGKNGVFLLFPFPLAKQPPHLKVSSKGVAFSPFGGKGGQKSKSRGTLLKKSKAFFRGKANKVKKGIAFF